MASSLSSSAFMGDRWTIEIGECCLPIRVMETNSPIVCWHWLGSRSTETICWNLCIDSVHPNWIDKHKGNRAPEYLRKELKSNRELGLRRTRGYDKLHLKSVKTEWGRKFFGFQAAQDWNNLPEDIRQ